MNPKPSSSNSSGQWPPIRPSRRSKLRNGTFVIPTTGERSRRQFTLRHAPTGLENANNNSDLSRNDDDDESSSGMFSRKTLAKPFRYATHGLLEACLNLYKFLGTPKGRGVLKCTLAYVLASLMTFIEPASDFLGKRDGKHVVATITVYFHPARSAGSMIEATLIAIVAIAYAAVVSLSSMATSVFVGSVLDKPTLAHILVLVFFVAGGFGFIGWVKQRMNNPLVNVGGTLASLAIISVVTRENATFASVWDNTKMVQVFKMLVIGITITASVNLLLWRTFARDTLRKAMGTSSTSLGEMLSYVTHSFLSGKEEELLSEQFSSSVSVYHTSYTTMTNVLREAKYEHYFLGHERVYSLDKAVYKSIETLAQSIGGLKSAANTQFALLRESAATAVDPDGQRTGDVSPTSIGPPTLFSPSLLSRSFSSSLKSGLGRHPALSAIDEATDEGSSQEGSPRPFVRRSNSESNATQTTQPAVFRTSSDIFSLFIELLGPSMKSLAFTLSEILREPAFGAAPHYVVNLNDNFRPSLMDALGLYNEARGKALNELYKNIELGRPNYSDDLKADFEEVAAACGHFSFSLQTFGEEMSKYLDVLDDLKHAAEDGKAGRSWEWLRFWRKNRAHSLFNTATTLPYEHRDQDQESLVRPIRRSQLPKGIPSTMTSHRDTYSWQLAGDEANKHVSRFAQGLLRWARRWARDDFRFGLKVGIGAMLWAMLAFIPSTRPTYSHWRGEWGLLSFMVVCSMTVGASNTTGISRFIGTVFGTALFLVNWTVSDGNPVVLAILGGFVAFYNFVVIVARGNAPLGRTALLAYNVTALYAYSISQRVDDDDDDEGGMNPYIGEIALHRSLAVTAGIIYGLFVCRVVWPISARKKFKEGLSVLYLQMGLIWKRGPLAILLRSDCTRSYLKSGEQVALQRYASRLETLRRAAASEFELRGPFPFDTVGRILAATNRILDAFYAMSLVTQRRGHLSDGERELLLFTAKERAVLCDRICHVFQVLASSIMLEYPMTESIPSVTHTRDRLLGKIFWFRKEHAAAGAALAAVEGSIIADEATSAMGMGSSRPPPPPAPRRRSSEASVVDKLGDWARIGAVTVEERDYALLYAYALVTGQVAEELKMVEKEIENLYGVFPDDVNLLE
ncbi:hypothetical protein MCOR07_006196 [Pyricularia oryzae]|nr:hypothetical protein MCOR07_006196 [Pyricularia oryzae]